MLETLLRRLDMVRLTVAAMTMLLATACSGLIDDGGTQGLTPEEQQARQLFISKALPQLVANCQVCHDGSRANIGFMQGGSDLEKREALLAYQPQVVNTDAPGSSRLLSKGPHEGPPLNAIQTSDLLEWIQAEREAVGGGVTDPGLRTEPVLVSICTAGLPDEPANPNPNCLVNNIPLDAVGDGVPGGRISFVVQALSSGLYVTNLKLVPGANGAFIEHPLFVAFGEDGANPRKDCELLDAETGAVACTDTIDRFFSVKMNLQPDAAVEDQLIAGGAHTFVGFRPTDKIAIHFKAISPFQQDGGDGGDGTIAGGCKDLEAFKAAKGALTGAGLGQNCASCHAGADPNATTTMNITQINSTDDAQLLLACNQVRSRINFQDFNQSSLFQAPDPNGTNHPVKFNATDFQKFKDTLVPWMTAERDAP